MIIYVCSPPRCATGGVELLQQLVFELNRQCPGVAQILYIDPVPESGYPVPAQYAKYQNPFTINACMGKDSVFILPEVYARMSEGEFKGHPVIIWWESVDNYFKSTPCKEWYSFAKNQSLLHLTQSAYAKGFLTENVGVPEDRILEVSDYLGDDFLTEKSRPAASVRKPNVLYNPRKGLDFTQKLMKASPNLHWTAIENMTPAETSALMSESSVYIDFGDHPGKDRMPREAAISGCLVITGRNGSASYYEDVPIMGKYKFERKDSNIPAICSCIEQLVDEYETHTGDFEYYRSVIRKEKAKFETAVSKLLTVLQQNYPVMRERKNAKSALSWQQDIISIAVYGVDIHGADAKHLIERRYNAYLQESDPDNCKFKVEYFVAEMPRILTLEGTPVVGLEKFIMLYRQQKVAGIVIPTPAFVGQSFLVTKLVQAGVNTDDIYFIERSWFRQSEKRPEETAQLLLPYTNCP